MIVFLNTQIFLNKYPNKEVMGEGLVGKFNANVGDIILLFPEKVDSGQGEIRVAGYVVSIDKGYVEISHENPFEKSSKHFLKGGRTSFTQGNRIYNLTKYQKLEILKSRTEAP